MPEMNTSR